MKYRMIAALGMTAALLMTGCGGQSTAGAQPEAAQEAASGETEEETGGIAAYESDEGWSCFYDSDVIEVSQDDGVCFNYIGEAEGTNQINVKYYADEMPDEVLYNAMAGEDGLPDHTRSEDYFAGRTDVWSIRTSMESKEYPNATEDFIAVERNDGTLLIRIVVTDQKDEATGISVSDALAEVIDSFELEDQQPQTYSQYVPGKYVASAEDGIEGEETGTEYYVELNDDHTGLIHMQDDVDIIWYSREGEILSAETGEQIYEYTVEGDSLYLMDVAEDGQEDRMSLEFTRVSGEEASGTEATDADTETAAED